MDNNELDVFLDELDELIDEELSVFFDNSPLRGRFSRLVRLFVCDDASFSDEVLKELDVLTDNMDLYNFGIVKEDIVKIRELLD